MSKFMPALLTSSVLAYRHTDYREMILARTEARVNPNELMDVMENSIVIDTRSDADREMYDISVLEATPEKYVVVDSKNFMDKAQFFESFQKESFFYNVANDGHDVDLFPEMSVHDCATTPLPESVVETGKHILLVCGGNMEFKSQWGRLYNFGFREVAWFGPSLNDFIDEAEFIN